MRNIRKFQQSGKFPSLYNFNIPTLELKNDATTVSKPLIIPRFKRQLLSNEILMPNGLIIKLPLSTLLSLNTQTNYQQEQSRKKAEPIYKEIENLAKTEKAIGAIGGFANMFMPSTLAGAVIDASKGKNSVVSSMIEGNNGLGNSAANLAFDIFAPIGLAKGMGLVSRTLPKVNRFMASPLTGEWTLFGNNVYRLSPTLNSGINPKIEKSRILFLRNPKLNPITEEDLPKLKNMFENGLYNSMTYTPYNGTPQQIKMYLLGGNKLPIPENELLSILETYYPRTLSQEELNFAKLAPNLVKKLELQGIKFGDDSWFGNRLYSEGKDKVTLSDLDIYHSHIPEYYDLALRMLESKLLYSENNKWYGNFADGIREVNPEEYVVAHSNAFKNNGWYYDGINRMRAMTNKQYEDLLGNGGLNETQWTTTGREQLGVFSGEGPRKGGKIVKTIVGNVSKKNWKEVPTKYAREALRSNTYGVEYSPNVEYKNTIGDYTLFGKDVPIKSLRGNNGDFSKFRRGIYKAIIPTIIGGTFVKNSNSNE